ncbi:uncharacterized protein P174DRAFT_428901 [Aspergillus novofumigatus IBT 16806]|uniref:Uncharacterized protein n=1 Tax=Aspergillus novofumigatus (strain IBT 16806) TaxID=1392255 RepID=A0A2I1CIL0_ASPN1|nr:uncharacterized protein P174DRAFT_428901 [Aspergillus novofumigatus IBT 16806]PKX97465.1 hypothetical protein P174DRAFT_428901 [Aspergillus novofumigatus IBT 16806]
MVTTDIGGWIIIVLAFTFKTAILGESSDKSGELEKEEHSLFKIVSMQPNAHGGNSSAIVWKFQNNAVDKSKLQLSFTFYWGSARKVASSTMSSFLFSSYSKSAKTTVVEGLRGFA